MAPQTSMTSAMSCSTSRTAGGSQPEVRTRRTSLKCGRLVGVEPRARLVEEQHPGVGAQGAAQLDHAALPGRELAGHPVGQRATGRAGSITSSTAPAPPGGPGRGRHRGATTPTTPRGCRAPSCRVKRARRWNVRAMPARPRRCGGQPRDVVAPEEHGALCRLAAAREHVEHRRLAGAVGADEPDDLARGAPRARPRSSALRPPKRTEIALRRQHGAVRPHGSATACLPAHRPCRRARRSRPAQSPAPGSSPAAPRRRRGSGRSTPRT